jgi:hypothetical protein
MIEQIPTPCMGGGDPMKQKTYARITVEPLAKLLCLHRDLRKNRCSKELANFQRAKTTEAVPLWDGFGVDDVTIRDPK